MDGGTLRSLASGQRRHGRGTGGRTCSHCSAHLSANADVLREHRALSKVQRIVAHGRSVEQGEMGARSIDATAIREIHAESLDASRGEGATDPHRLHARNRGARQSTSCRTRRAPESRFVSSVSTGQRESSRVLIQLCRFFSGAIFNPGDHAAGLLPDGDRSSPARTCRRARRHSQIDHLLVSRSWESLGGFASDGGSDHRALVADVRLA